MIGKTKRRTGQTNQTKHCPSPPEKRREETQKQFSGAGEGRGTAGRPRPPWLSAACPGGPCLRIQKKNAKSQNQIIRTMPTCYHHEKLSTFSLSCQRDKRETRTRETKTRRGRSPGRGQMRSIRSWYLKKEIGSGAKSQ